MAARKLKFKPKPIVGGAVRRPRDVKEEIPELKPQEPIISQESPQRNSILNSDSKSCQSDLCDANEGDITKRLSVNEVENVVVSQTCSEGKIPDLSDVPATLNLSDTIKTINDTSHSKPSNHPINSINKEQTQYLDSNKQDSLESLSVSSVESSVKFVEPVSSQDSISSDRSSETNVPTLGNVCEESSLNVKASASKDVAKVVPRFGRSKVKPVLSSSRKKNEPNDIQIEKNLESDVYPVAIVRTQSVIECAPSEIKKSNFVPEITASFSNLESDESVPSVNLSQMEEQNIHPKTSRFDFGNKVPKNDKGGTNKNIQSNVLPVTNNAKGNLGSSDSRQDNSNQIDQTLNKERAKKTALVSSPTKVPISPVKPSSKILVPKPSPNLMDTGVRRISFQGSDSEEDVKRNVVLQKHDKTGKRPVKGEKDVKSKKRKLSQGLNYSKLGQEALVKFNQKFGKGAVLNPPDKAKLTMLDLIFYNPKSNPMTAKTEQPAVRKKEEKIEVNPLVKQALAEEKVDDVEEVEPPAPAVPVPQLKVGPDGQIMLDPQSLVIETTDVKEKRAEMEKSEVIRETGITRYNTYSKKKHFRRDWSAQETLQFYKALNTIGSDFSLMTKLFPNRSRHELKLKFKKEEKTNMKLIDKAMTAPTDFDFSSLEQELRQENEEIAKIAEMKKLAMEEAKKERALKKEEKALKKTKYPSSMKTKAAVFKSFDETEIDKMKAKTNNKRKRKKRKLIKKEPATVMISSSSDEDDLVVDMDMDSDETELEESEKKLLEMIRKKTKAGMMRRFSQPKKLEEYEKINETLKRKLEEIDSDISDDGYTPNGFGDNVLFRSPERESTENLVQDGDGSQWSIEVTSAPSVEETVLLKNVEGVCNNVHLGSVEQTSAAEPPLPFNASSQENRQNSETTPSVLNRHLISESIQIIDQLTSSENLNETVTTAGKQQNGDHLSNPIDVERGEILGTPSTFESVTCPGPPVLYEDHISIVCDSENYKSSKKFLNNGVAEDQAREKIDNQQIVLYQQINNSEECILGS